LAAAPGAQRLYDPIFSANFGIATADLPEFFAQAKTALQENGGRESSRNALQSRFTQRSG
jgi:hypothetical protein